MSDKKKLVWMFDNGLIPLKVSHRENISDRKLYENAGIQLSADKKEYIYLDAEVAEFGSAEDNNLNENDRWYGKEAYLKEVENLQGIISEGRLFGAMDHDEEYMIKMKEVSHMVTKLWFDEESGRVKIQIKLIPTVIGGGLDAIAIVEAGGTLSVSARAIGFYDEDTKEASVDTIFTYDIVSIPGFVFAKLVQIMNSGNRAIAEMSEADLKIIKNLKIGLKSLSESFSPLKEEGEPDFIVNYAKDAQVEDVNILAGDYEAKMNSEYTELWKNGTKTYAMSHEQFKNSGYIDKTKPLNEKKIMSKKTKLHESAQKRKQKLNESKTKVLKDTPDGDIEVSYDLDENGKVKTTGTYDHPRWAQDVIDGTTEFDDFEGYGIFDIMSTYVEALVDDNGYVYAARLGVGNDHTEKYQDYIKRVESEETK